jgi:hypothetical protein
MTIVEAKLKSAPSGICSRCGTILLAQPTPQSLPVQPAPTQPGIHNLGIEFIRCNIDTGYRSRTCRCRAGPSTPPEVLPHNHVLQKAEVRSLVRIKYQELVYEDEHENLYTVTEICQTATCVRICSNCRTFISTRYRTGEFLHILWSHSGAEPPQLVLGKQYIPIYQSIAVIERNGASNIHPPISTFQENLPVVFATPSCLIHCKYLLLLKSHRCSIGAYNSPPV